jgi:adenylate cyclase
MSARAEGFKVPRSDHIDDYRGEIHQYVGDEMVITWLEREGRPEARPIGCFTAIEAAAPDFVRNFGVAPRVRGALHFGPVVVGEVGGRKRDIGFHGDVMNTTSRLEPMARELNRPLVVSADAWRRLLAHRWAVEDLGQIGDGKAPGPSFSSRNATGNGGSDVGGVAESRKCQGSWAVES